MSDPTPTIRVPVDVTNPGQFFACCGLLEMADRLWPGAEGWFDRDRLYFNISCKGDFSSLIDAIQRISVSSSVGAAGLKRLGTLMSVATKSLAKMDLQEKVDLRAKWHVETLRFTGPIEITVDWWWNASRETTVLKTWAAKQFILGIVEPMLESVKAAERIESDEVWTSAPSSVGLPLYFDSSASSQSTALDAGFSGNDIGLDRLESFDPLVELMSFIAFQRFRPVRGDEADSLGYALWHYPFSPTVAAAAMAGAVISNRRSQFRFRVLKRTTYMKALLPANPIGDTI